MLAAPAEFFGLIRRIPRTIGNCQGARRKLRGRGAHRSKGYSYTSTASLYIYSIGKAKRSSISVYKQSQSSCEACYPVGGSPTQPEAIQPLAQAIKAARIISDVFLHSRTHCPNLVCEGILPDLYRGRRAMLDISVWSRGRPRSGLAVVPIRCAGSSSGFCGLPGPII